MSSSFDPVQSDRLEVTSEAGAALTEFDYRVMASVLKMTHSLRWPKDAISYLAERIALEGFQIPVSQLSGFTGFTAQGNVVATQETTATATYTDLATVGPTLTALPNGLYVVLHGCNAATTDSGQPAYQTVQVNSAAAADTEACRSVTTTAGSIAIGFLTTLSNADNNTLTCKYRIGSALQTGTYLNRWVIALKYQEL